MKRLLPFAFAVTLVATPAQAQEDLLNACATLQATTNPALPVGVNLPSAINDQFQFLCGQVANAVTNVQPSMGIAFSGGAHTLGSYSTIGRRLGFFPRISATARLNAAYADVPDLFGGFSPSISDGGQLDAMPTAALPLASLQGDVVIGLLNGFSFTPLIGGVGSVDLLGSVSFIPAVEQVQDVIGLEEDIINIGVGARVGLLKQGLVVPGISVSAMYRTMGEVTFGDLNNPDPAAFSTDLSVLSFRGGISKGILMFDLAAGAGYDIYTSDVAFNWALDYDCGVGVCGPGAGVYSLQPTGPVEGELKTAAWNVHANVGLSILVLNLVGEVGYQKATDVIDASTLSDAGLPSQAPTEEALEGGRFFASIGLKLTL